MTVAGPLLAQASDLSRVESAFVRMVDQALTTPWLGVVAVAAAFGVGALHALAPGHGKAVAGAYLVGGRGRPRDAVVLGTAVAAMHTVSVIVLALGVHLLLHARGDLGSSLTSVTPALRVASGLAVMAVGIYLLLRQRRGHDHAHRDQAEAASPFTRRGLIVLGLSGGLLPSPSAFLVVVTSAFMGRLWFGLALVIVFSIGLATTLTLVGLAAVHGREALVRRLGTATRGRFARWAARGAAGVVALGGAVMAGAGLLAL